MPDLSYPLSRRALLARAAAAGLLVGPGAGLLAACGKKSKTPAAATTAPVATTSTSAAPSSSAASSSEAPSSSAASTEAPSSSAAAAGSNPFNVKPDAPLDVVIFNGGYTDKYAVQVHEPMYKAEFPNATIKHESVVEISTELQPRFAAGNPPDFVNNSGA
ncbi:MAG: N-acetylglucosamine transport system substrate-binding protein, partial [Frankiaceae bacterium]|nr:N-acetylglucosamine transport system substrate-binding protein [Frankiaceae bacterium]